MLRARLLVLTVAAMHPIVIFAQVETKLVASDGDRDDRFGTSVSASGSFVLVGAWLDDSVGANAGSAYVFQRKERAWIQIDNLIASDAEKDDQFGMSVSIDEHTALIGAVGDDVESGAAYFFQWQDSTWIEVDKVTASDGTEGDRFGTSVAIDGDYAIVGAPYDDDRGEQSGAAYVFRRQETGWIEMAKLTADDGEASDQFGNAVSLSGPYAIVGAPYDNDNGTDAGAAYVFQRQDTAWTLSNKLIATDGQAFDQFGHSVSITEDFAIVGAEGDDDIGFDAGTAYIFRRVIASWLELRKLVASDGNGRDKFGHSVSMHGDSAIVGALLGDARIPGTGAAYIFDRKDLVWTERNKLAASDGVEFDNFGRSVSISGDIAVVGSWKDDDRGADSGSAYVYDLSSSPTSIAVEEPEGEMVPARRLNAQAYPNPFSTTIHIEYELDEGGPVIVTVYDMLGRRVEVVSEGIQAAGAHRVEWNPETTLFEGIYWLRIATPKSGIEVVPVVKRGS